MRNWRLAVGLLIGLLLGGGIAYSAATQLVTICDFSGNCGSVTSGGGITVSDGVAQGSTTSGQIGPLVQGAVVTGTSSYTNGQTSPVNLDAAGELKARLSVNGSIVGSVIPADSVSNAQNALVVLPFAQLFNGLTWERSVICTNTATVSVTAGNTTQIVALSGTTVIRVCSFTVSLSAAGTAQWITGTGTNCGTPTSITAAVTLGTTIPWVMNSGGGQTLFRGTAGGELCLAAVTGNATGFVTYAQY